MNKELIKTWHQLKPAEKKEIFSQAAAQWNLPAAAIEKDWWVVRTLELIFSTEIAPYTVFKGGTSQRPAIKIERKSRHLYDLEKLMDTDFAKNALSNKSLYQQIVEHRRTITPVRRIDYALHAPKKINPVPPVQLLGDWKKDYLLMQESMLYTDSLSFEKLIERITELKDRINQINN